ncbi:MAG: methyltransferase domain-containing protein [Candidatus Omnitrophota bacterium]
MSHSPFYDWIDHRLAAERQLVEIARITGLGQGRMLEFGCGDGAYLAYFQSRGWECLGVADDPDCAKAAFDEYQVLMITGHPAEAGIPRSSYDLIRIRGLLSYDEHPEKTLQAAFAAAAPTGYLIAEIWNGSGWPVLPASCAVKRTFNRESFSAIIAQSGFEPGGVIAPEMGDPVWAPYKANSGGQPFILKKWIDKIQGFFDRGSLLILFAQKPPAT